ncbi:respiratory nitrate reductase subunit gamma [Bacillus marinisedimentorum]|uniref:respiratory nitrate reductase subunit gamma n=1 Tax=Bacillus marinisedimentorum TaxID=1821260 RepID=UPI0008734209|nr:respiratory nitrate reductase subunit gamma [Bacillus marinisedimentorum]
MNLGSMILWMVLPYMAIAILFMGIVWHYDDAYIRQCNEDGRNFFEKTALLTLIVLGISTAGSLLNGTADIVLQWLLSLAVLNPDIQLMENAALTDQVLGYSIFFFIVIWPFTGYIRILTNIIDQISGIMLLFYTGILRLIFMRSSSFHLIKRDLERPSANVPFR